MVRAENATPAGGVDGTAPQHKAWPSLSRSPHANFSLALKLANLTPVGGDDWPYALSPQHRGRPSNARTPQVYLAATLRAVNTTQGGGED